MDWFLYDSGLRHERVQSYHYFSRYTKVSNKRFQTVDE